MWGSPRELLVELGKKCSCDSEEGLRCKQTAGAGRLCVVGESLLSVARAQGQTCAASWTRVSIRSGGGATGCRACGHGRTAYPTLRRARVTEELKEAARLRGSDTSSRVCRPLGHIGGEGSGSSPGRGVVHREDARGSLAPAGSPETPGDSG